MKRTLQVLAGADAKLVKEFTVDVEAEIVDLKRKDVDYRVVLEKIFEADSVQVW